MRSRSAIVEATAVITPHVRLGGGVYVGHRSVVGTAPEDASQRDAFQIQSGSHAGVTLGDGVVIRDLCAVHGGKVRPTEIGDDCYLHSGTHVNHDCVLGRKATLAPGVYLAGDVRVGDEAQIGMCATVHQRVQVGAYSMIGMNATVIEDVPAFALVVGTPARVIGANRVLLSRRGLDETAIAIVDALVRGDIRRSDVDFRQLPDWVTKEILSQ